MATQDLVFRFKGVDAGAGAMFDALAECASRISSALADLSTYFESSPPAEEEDVA